MLDRLDHEHGGEPFPKAWINSVFDLLSKVYLDSHKVEEFNFEVYGHHFEKECLLIVSRVNKKSSLVCPITYFLSADLADGEDFSVLAAPFLDLAGQFFDQVFATEGSEEWNDYITQWAPHQFQDRTYYIKVTRENIALTKQADKLLKEDIS